MSRILVVEDEVGSAAAVRIYLERLGHEVRLSGEGEHALALLPEFEPELVLCDWVLGQGMDGLEVAERLREVAPTTRFVLMTGMPSAELEERLSGAPICQVLHKPIGLSDLEAVVGSGPGAIKPEKRQRW